jgi:two-component system sensor histidine kinase/response regulator
MSQGTQLSDGAVATPLLAEEKPPQGTPAAWRVLVVEDVPSQQKLLVTMLRKYGHAVVAVDNGQAAIDTFQREPFDIILMDVQMPGMDGLSATRAIRACEVEQGGHVPIVAITAHALGGDAEKCLAAGTDAYLRKPVNLVGLMALLERLIAESGEHTVPGESII